MAEADERQLELVRRVAALAQTGLAYTKDVFDRERFEELREIAAELLAGPLKGRVLELLANERGYATPKLDVRAAVFDQGRILLVRERSDGRWTMPGGWADVGLSPAACAEKEVREEAGLVVRAVKLIGCLDKLKQAHPPDLFHAYKLFFLCEVEGGALAPSVETSEVAYFSENALPDLSTARVTAAQIARAFAHLRDPSLPTDFD